MATGAKDIGFQFPDAQTHTAHFPYIILCPRTRIYIGDVSGASVRQYQIGNEKPKIFPEINGKGGIYSQTI